MDEGKMWFILFRSNFDLKFPKHILASDIYQSIKLCDKHPVINSDALKLLRKIFPDYSSIINDPGNNLFDGISLYHDWFHYYTSYVTPTLKSLIINGIDYDILLYSNEWYTLPVRAKSYITFGCDYGVDYHPNTNKLVNLENLSAFLINARWEFVSDVWFDNINVTPVINHVNINGFAYLILVYSIENEDWYTLPVAFPFGDETLEISYHPNTKKLVNFDNLYKALINEHCEYIPKQINNWKRF